MQGIPGLAEKMLASQESLFSLELLGWFVICLVEWLVGFLVG